MADFNSDNAIIDEVLTNLKSNAEENYLVPQPNLLINGDFRIWQRGTSFVAPNNQYTADRWRANGSGTVTANNGYKVVGNVTIVYTMESSDFTKINGKTVTLSYQFSGEDIVKSTFTAASAVVCSLEITNKTLLWVKLELGDTATAFVPRLYAEELALCQRYYEHNDRNMAEAAYVIDSQARWARTFLNFRVTKRVNPTVSIYPNTSITSTGIRQTSNGAIISGNNIIVSANVYGVNYIELEGLTANTWYDFMWEADAEIY